jgi:hypothetical protein
MLIIPLKNMLRSQLGHASLHNLGSLTHVRFFWTNNFLFFSTLDPLGLGECTNGSSSTPCSS